MKQYRDKYGQQGKEIGVVKAECIVLVGDIAYDYTMQYRSTNSCCIMESDSKSRVDESHFCRDDYERSCYFNRQKGVDWKKTVYFHHMEKLGRQGGLVKNTRDTYQCDFH